MHTTTRSLFTSLSLVLALSATSSAQVLDVGADAVRRFFLSSNGEAGAGQLVDPSGVAQVFRWTSAGGVEVLPAPGNPGASARAISRDGSIVCGTTIEPGDTKRAIRWDASGAPLDLTPAGAIGSVAAAMSADGLTVALTVVEAEGRRAAIWTPGFGTIDIHAMVGGPESALILLSEDGSTAVGREIGPFGTTQDFFIWSVGTGVMTLPRLNGVILTATDISADGTYVAGYVPAIDEGEVYRWSSATGIEVAPTAQNVFMTGSRLSSDGAVVYGVVPDFLGGPSSRLFRWAPPAAIEIITPPTFAVLTGATGDGEILSGTMAENQSVPGRAFHYTTASGVVELDDLPSESRATSISEDGSRTGGTYVTSRGNRAVLWLADGEIGDSFCGPGVPNSSGASGTMSVEGTNISEFNSLTLTAKDIPVDAFGLFIASTVTSFVAQPGGSQGNLCLGGSIGRFVGPGEIQNAGSTGTFSLEIDPQALPGPNGPILPSFGETWHFQAWHRDANPGATSNFTDAVALPIF